MSVVRELSWDTVTRMGGDLRYYEIDQWLHIHDTDQKIGELLGNPPETRRWSPFTAWRILFVQSLHEWTLASTIREVRDRLGLRCFVRLLSLDSHGPSPATMRSYANEFAEVIDLHFRNIAHDWALDVVKRPRRNRPSSVEELMERWSTRILASAPRLLQTPPHSSLSL